MFIGSQQTQHVELHKDDLDHVASSQDLDMEAQIREDNNLATAMDPRDELLTHHSGGRNGDEDGLR
jgi:hypothetical protein